MTAWERRGLDLVEVGRDARRCAQWPYHAKERLWARAGYTPFAAQRRFHQSPARFKVMTAGARFGKSLSAAMDALPEVMTPNTRGWIVGPTYDLAFKEFRYIYEALRTLGQTENVRARLEMIEQKSTPSIGRAMLRTTWGSTVETRSADNPDSLLGEELDWLIVAEAAKIRGDVWERYLRARLDSRLGRGMIPTTPSGTGWVYEAYRRGLIPLALQGDWAGTFESWNFPNVLNPLMPWEAFESARAQLDPDVFNEQYLGLFVRRSGLVYKLDPAVHVIDAMPNGWQSWGLWRGIDFGFNNPFACVWMTKDPDGRWYVVDEHYKTQTLLHQHASTIKDKYRGVPLKGTVADHDAQDRAELNHMGISTMPASKDIEKGINTVKNHMRVQGDRRPRFFVMRRCKNVLAEFDQYVYQEPSVDSKNKKEEPKDWANHALDAIRYIMHTFTPTATPLYAAASPGRDAEAPAFGGIEIFGGGGIDMGGLL